MGRLEAALRLAGVNCGVPRRLGAAEAGGGSAPPPVHSDFEWAAAFEPRVTDWRAATGRWTRPRCTSDSREEGASPPSQTSLFKNGIYLCMYLFSRCVYALIRAVARGWRSEDNSWVSFFSFQSVDPWNRTHTARLGSKCFYLLRPLRLSQRPSLFVSRVPLQSWHWRGSL